jgi:hypothetical protein
MSGFIDIRTEGGEEILQALASIDQPHLDKLLRDSMMKGAGKMKPAVARMAPRWSTSSREGGSMAHPTHPGDLPRSIAMKRGRKSRPPAAIVYANKSKPGGWISHFVIGGTKPHSLAKRGTVAAARGQGFHSPGTRPNPYMTRGGQAGTPAALYAIKQHIANYWKSLEA